jgi:hypothetical protein
MALTGIGMAWISWQKTCDPIIDFGRELYIPWALSQGKVLYQDINMFFYGPLPYYLNALLFKIFGIHLNVIIGFNLVLIAVIACLIHSVMKAVSNAVCAFVSVISFITLFAFPRYFPILNDNFVTPYSHAATHGMALSFLAFFLVSHYVRTGRMVYACFCWLVIGLVLLTKVEIFAGIFFSMLFTWGWILHAEKPKARIIMARLLAWALLVVLPLFLFAAFLTPYSTFPGAIRGILNPYILIFHGGHSFSNLLTNMMGMDQPLANTRSMLFWLFIYTLAALIITAVNHLLHTFTKKGRSRVISTAIAVLISAPLISITTGGRAPYLDYFLPLPLVVGLFALYMILELGKTKPYSIEWKRALLSMSLSVFSLILLTRIFFNAKIIHYGFFLALPGFLVLLSLCLHRLPALMKRTTGDARIGLIPVMILIGCVLWSYCGRSFALYRIVDYPIKSNGEVINSFDPKYGNSGQVVQEAVDKIRAVVAQDETLTAFPEGLMFNYLARRQSASAYTAFLPTFFSVFGGAILSSLQEKPPDFVLLVERSTIEHGHAYFGVDYATEVLRWIKENYMEISQIGKEPLSGEGFGIVIMKRISS